MMRSCSSLLYLSMAFGVVAMACSDDRPGASASSVPPSPPSSSGSSGAPGDGGIAVDAGEEAGASLCEGVVQLSQTHQEIQVPGDPPASTGGTIKPGKYVVNELNAYETSVDGGSDPPPPGPTGRIVRSTLYVTATTMRFVEADATEPADLPADMVRGVTYRVTGTTLETTGVCPETSASATIPFSASGNLLTFHVGPKRTLVYLLKP